MTNASESGLRAAHLPPRPEAGASPAQFKDWSSFVGGHRHFVAPVCTSLDAEDPGGPASTTASANDLYNGSNTSYNWAGYDATGRSFTYAEMTWTVPSVTEPGNLTVVSSIWPGLGTGNSSGDLLIQAGTEQDGALYLGSIVRKSYSTWWEAYPANKSQGLNIAISPGDTFYVQVGKTASNVAYYYLANETSGAWTSFTKSFAGSTILGKQADWIVERTKACGVSCTFPSLNNFGRESLGTAQGYSGSSWFPLSSLTRNTFTMYDKAGTELAYPTAIGTGGTTFNVQWLNYGNTDPA